MKHILLLVEGQSEKIFVDNVLREYLIQKGIVPVAKVVTNKPMVGAKDIQGGLTNYAKVRKEILRLLGDTQKVLLTTMFDLYELPTDFPDYHQSRSLPLTQRVEMLEKGMQKDIQNRKFLPYIGTYEFEAILFSNTEVIAKSFPDKPRLEELNRIKGQFDNPEHINDEMPPSKRLKQLFIEYEKPIHGYFIADDIGIPAMRAECPHFDDWLNKIEEMAHA